MVETISVATRVNDREYDMQAEFEEIAKNQLATYLKENELIVTGRPQIWNWKTQSYVTYDGVSMRREWYRHQKHMPNCCEFTFSVEVTNE